MLTSRSEAVTPISPSTVDFWRIYGGCKKYTDLVSESNAIKPKLSPFLHAWTDNTGLGRSGALLMSLQPDLEKKTVDQRKVRYAPACPLSNVPKLAGYAESCVNLLKSVEEARC